MRRSLPIRPSLTRSLRRSAKSCRRAVDAYVADTGLSDQSFARAVTAAVTALDAAVLASDRDRGSALLAETATACDAAAEACRSHGLDRAMLTAADCFDRAAALCARAAA